MLCKIVDIINICVVLAIVIDPHLARHNDNMLLTEDGTNVNNLSSINNATSYIIRNRILNPSKWQNA